MGTYATVQGVISYPDKESLDKVVDYLTEHFYMKDRKFFVGGTEETVKNECIIGLKLIIPHTYYRNMLSVLDYIINQSKDYHIVWTCTDGMFSGGILDSENKEKEYDLSEYAKSKGMKSPGYSDFERYCEWLAEVEQTFHQEFELD